jgi:hypothetical protein
LTRGRFCRYLTENNLFQDHGTVLKDFTYLEYRNLLERLRESRTNLCFSDFRGPVHPDRFYLLRHDVDFCPQRALEMARVEAELKVRATYFLLLSATTYNLLAPELIAIPRQLVALGHEVGLHYDLRALEAAGSPVLPLIQDQARLLGNIAGTEIRAVCMHNPSTDGTDPLRHTGAFVNAYEAAFTEDIFYASDSCGAWRDQTYALLTRGPLPARLQLLIHPIYWDERPGDRSMRLRGWLRGRTAGLEDYARHVVDLWKDHDGVREHDRRQGGTSTDDVP